MTIILIVSQITNEKVYNNIIASPFCANAQNIFGAVIKNDDTKEPTQGATVQIKNLKISTTNFINYGRPTGI